MRKLKWFFLFIIFFGISGNVFDAYLICSTGKLYVGTARMDITPPVGIKMSSYSLRRPSREIHDSLYVKVLVLEVDGYRTAIISCDLLWYYNKAVLDAARERFNISHTLICFSHTHSGPNLRDSETYALSVEKAMIDGIDKALKNMFPARISAGYKSFPQLGYNRLTNKGDGIAQWRDYERIPYGPVDPEVGVIKIEDEDGNPRVILMQYACHPVVNGHTVQISADYPGVAARKVEETFGNNALCMFIQGGAGDINPMFQTDDRGFREGNKDKDYIPQTDFGQIETMGTLLADEVIETAKRLSPKENEKAALKAISDSLKFKGRFDKDINFDIHITTVLINNDIVIATFPGEPFVEFQFFWKEKAEAAHPFFFGYTFSSGGKNPGYVCDIRSAAYGGYGADASSKIIEVGAGETIMNRHRENLYRLKGIMRETPRSRK
ncbi:hypothetical protein KAS50_02335 [bacterium]|nr:hypothetical protein [bacterium]